MEDTCINIYTEKIKVIISEKLVSMEDQKQCRLHMVYTMIISEKLVSMEDQKTYVFLMQFCPHHFRKTS